MKKSDKQFLTTISLLLTLGGILSLFGEATESVMAIAWWIPMMMAGAARGGLKAKRQQEQAEEHDDFRREVIKYSPWTEMQDPGGMDPQGTLEGIIGGGAGGAMLGMAGQNLLGGTDAVVPPTGDITGMGDPVSAPGPQMLPSGDAVSAPQAGPTSMPAPARTPQASAGALGGGLKQQAPLGPGPWSQQMLQQQQPPMFDFGQNIRY